MPWQEIIGILGTIIMVGIGILGWVRNHRGDAKTDGRESATTSADIVHIKSGIDEIKARLDRREREYVDVIKQLATIQTDLNRISQLDIDARLSAVETTLRQLVSTTLQDILKRLERLESR